MLPKTHRIAKGYFPYILQNSKRFNSQSLLLYIAPIKEKTKNSEFSFSVSKKVAPLASDRNKYRRWGYAALQTHLKQVASPYFYFFSFKKSKTPLSFAALEREIEELLRASNMLV